MKFYEFHKSDLKTKGIKDSRLMKDDISTYLEQLTDWWREVAPPPVSDFYFEMTELSDTL